MSFGSRKAGKMSRAALAHVTDWIFDLDNTLYPRECDLFAQIDKLITDYVTARTGLPRDQARKLQKDYYRDHGTTLNGLMTHHGVDPRHYLDYVHDIDYSSVAADPELVGAIAALPGRKFIFTNADSKHAAAVLTRLGGAGLFDGLYDISDGGFEPKPMSIAYQRFVDKFGIDPKRAVMFDDLEQNLRVPHRMGMSTVHVVPDPSFVHDQVDNWELARADGHEHVHHVATDLAGFLRLP